MGLFDDLLVDYPLPDRPEWAKTFQTKDLSCGLLHYRIDADGQLWEDASEGDHSERADVTAGINFYDFNDKTGEWVEYVALVKHGQLVHVELVELRGPTRGAPTQEPK